MENIDRTLTQLCLSLWSYSTRRVERLPRVTVYQPHERVEIVPIPEHLHSTRAGRFLARSEGAI